MACPHPTPVFDRLNALHLALLWTSIHAGIGAGNPVRERYFYRVCRAETGLQVQKYHPEALPRTDYAGAHYSTLFSEIQREGFLDGRWRTWKKDDPERLAWKELFKKNPELGTQTMATRFSWFCQKYGSIEVACKVWNQGDNGLLTAKEIKRLLISPKKKAVLIGQAIDALLYWQEITTMTDHVAAPGLSVEKT